MKFEDGGGGFFFGLGKRDLSRDADPQSVVTRASIEFGVLPHPGPFHL